MGSQQPKTVGKAAVKSFTQRAFAKHPESYIKMLIKSEMGKSTSHFLIKCRVLREAKMLLRMLIFSTDQGRCSSTKTASYKARV